MQLIGIVRRQQDLRRIVDLDRPAVQLDLVGKPVRRLLRLDLAQFREMAAFAQFGSDLDKATQRQLARGERLMEILKQGQYAPLPVELQIVSIYAGTKGHLDRLKVSAIGAFEPFLHRMAREEAADTIDRILETGSLGFRPYQRSIAGTRKPPSQLVFFSPRNGVIAASGHIL